MTKPVLADENLLLARIAEGSQSAFGLLFEHYHPFVYSFSRKITRSDELAVEAVQDVFLKIWLHRERLLDVEHFAAYLNRLVRNHCFNMLRKLANESRSVSASWDEFSLEDHSTVEKLEFNEVKQILDEAVGTLSPQQRRVYELCHQQGLKYDEVAAALNLSPQTVQSYMKEALRKIRSHFGKYAISYVVFFAALFR